ncbi:GNAT family N-acetyltransferase [Rhizobium sp. TH2]|uniref:GNAT family N-acetyltransferase n=1 Tax=Rhizobium sp. TH2 TaxID=2775403 RepID=UPI0021585B62|nr:GNAT family N-acetyltransferase [Rhizobium sp. TH2]UVC09356.1 GNAT family N-acetyltransferase [Rhizobium sp. TH2]
MIHQKIDTERLRLRRWKREDHAPFAELCSDPYVMQFIGNGSTRTAEQAGRSIASFEREWDEKGYGLFAVEEKRTGDLIGFTGLSRPDFLPEILPSIEIGWRFSRPSWGKGHASEAAAAALSFGVTELGISDIVSICQIGNRASVRIMQKLGMVFDRETIDPTCGREIEVYRLPEQLE